MSKAGIAISKSPIGPFKYIKSFRPNERESRDMTLFQDFDDSAYLVNSIDGNSNMSISRLNDDYTELSGETKLIFIGQYREAPAMFVHENKYYIITSGCSGWNPNSMLFGISDSVMGNWKLVENPCVGANYRKTFGGQSACIFKFGKHIMLLMDHWKTEDLRMSGYSILHVNIEQDTITIPWDENLIIESPPHPSEISL